MSGQPQTEAGRRLRNRLVAEMGSISGEFTKLLAAIEAQATAAARAEVARQVREAVPSVALSYPTGPKFIEHEEGCAFAYGNTTYSCYCLVSRSAVLALLEDAAPRQPEPETGPVCSECGTTAADFVSRHKRGCTKAWEYTPFAAAPDTTTETTDE